MSCADISLLLEYLFLQNVKWLDLHVISKKSSCCRFTYAETQVYKEN